VLDLAAAVLLKGRKALVTGIANDDQSIAWGCAKVFRLLGADLAVTYLNVGMAVAFLARDAAKLITGDTLYIDGGYHIID
jgi:enoyl-[acyl-carrier-protein] reductase (NADH)